MRFSEDTRKEIFDRAGGMCEKCEKQIVLKNHFPGQRGAWQAHHKTAVSSGGGDYPSNGKALCLCCHKKTHTYCKHKK